MSPGGGLAETTVFSASSNDGGSAATVVSELLGLPLLLLVSKLDSVSDASLADLRLLFPDGFGSSAAVLAVVESQPIDESGFEWFQRTN